MARLASFRGSTLSLVLLLLNSCAGPGVSHPWTLYVLAPFAAFDPRIYRGHDGSSSVNAVVLDGPKGSRAAGNAESAYIFKHYKVESQHAQRKMVQVGDRMYHLISIQTKGGKKRLIWFDVTSAIK
jgi:hypothetical protein